MLWHNILIHRYYSICQNFISFYYSILFHYLEKLHHVYLFVNKGHLSYFCSYSRCQLQCIETHWVFTLILYTVTLLNFKNNFFLQQIHWDFSIYKIGSCVTEAILLLSFHLDVFILLMAPVSALCSLLWCFPVQTHYPSCSASLFVCCEFHI